ncbi:YpoC family protein [Planomicrobium okeanokoites]|uniref:YpoC family protein n=1 Tax=Planomicrobium okeanokoites TaxID=244 RepID=A0ABV7KPQ3_PLAOK|nr:hypothetical protein [Planomicrobium okeanokoites]TAA71247.1 hypothetical protein D2910_02935 [Planomicrobium okeanokoites]
MSTLQRSIEKEKIMPFFVLWTKLEEEIGIIHTSKRTDASLFMKQGISVYKALLEQCSSEEETLEPLNNDERLHFVESYTSTYAAFRQLQELFIEMQKKVAAKRAILNRL